MAAVTRWRDDPEIRAREILLLVADGLAEAALRKDDAAKVRFGEAAALAASLNVQFPNQPMLQTNAAVVAFNSAKLLAEQALRIDGVGSSGSASARATARAAVEAALTEFEALLRRKALVPSARASNIEEARALLRRLGA
jgi:hypothetical protein